MSCWEAVLAAILYWVLAAAADRFWLVLGRRHAAHYQVVDAGVLKDRWRRLVHEALQRLKRHFALVLGAFFGRVGLKLIGQHNGYGQTVTRCWLVQDYALGVDQRYRCARSSSLTAGSTRLT
ncbi:hypothetical protein BpHYR1_043937 [Brachionus plicatilis]|uniref:Uncharacterized protein n=1 Tax=Brachionus plicatilis TaxID=10195 RepID=A0A3M7RJK7_BRAPC|nr:hypothetical protein BpHYR1_043937 [Brachionus plicatilis]